MTTSQRTTPVPFTPEDYAARMRRVVADAVDAGLDGVLITPGPDLVWLTGYQPTAITERLTVLVLVAESRADAAGAGPGATGRRGRRGRRRLDRRLGRRRGPVPGGEPLLAGGATGSPTRPGRCTCSGCRRRCRAPVPRADQGLPMMRAVKDAPSSPGWRRRAPPPTRHTARS